MLLSFLFLLFFLPLSQSLLTMNESTDDSYEIEIKDTSEKEIYKELDFLYKKARKENSLQSLTKDIKSKKRIKL